MSFYSLYVNDNAVVNVQDSLSSPISESGTQFLYYWVLLAILCALSDAMLAITFMTVRLFYSSRRLALCLSRNVCIGL
jgi:hypothetical protein